MHATPCIVNVGLPRTGTSSFARATTFLGFKSLHIWHQGEWEPEILARFRANDPECRRVISQFHTLSDTPFYSLRDTFETHYPGTLILYTTRPKEDWIRSMLRHKLAGGVFLSQLYNLNCAPPYTEANTAELGRLYDEHHERVCYDLPSIDLQSDNHREKWKLICSALPNAESCLALTESQPWPHTNNSTNESPAM